MNGAWWVRLAHPSEPILDADAVVAGPDGTVRSFDPTRDDRAAIIGQRLLTFTRPRDDRNVYQFKITEGVS